MTRSKRDTVGCRSGLAGAGASGGSPLHPQRRVLAQRKFAQGAPLPPPPPLPTPPTSGGGPQQRRRAASPPPPPNDDVTPLPKTEDFITFLCFRGTSQLPPHLNSFNEPPRYTNRGLSPTPPPTPSPASTPAKEPSLAGSALRCGHAQMSAFQRRSGPVAGRGGGGGGGLTGARSERAASSPALKRAQVVLRKLSHCSLIAKKKSMTAKRRAQRADKKARMLQRLVVSSSLRYPCSSSVVRHRRRAARWAGVTGGAAAAGKRRSAAAAAALDKPLSSAPAATAGAAAVAHRRSAGTRAQHTAARGAGVHPARKTSQAASDKSDTCRRRSWVSSDTGVPAAAAAASEPADGVTRPRVPLHCRSKSRFWFWVEEKVTEDGSVVPAPSSAGRQRPPMRPGPSKASPAQGRQTRSGRPSIIGVNNSRKSSLAEQGTSDPSAASSGSAGRRAAMVGKNSARPSSDKASGMGERDAGKAVVTRPRLSEQTASRRTAEKKQRSAIKADPTSDEDETPHKTRLRNKQTHPVSRSSSDHRKSTRCMKDKSDHSDSKPLQIETGMAKAKEASKIKKKPLKKEHSSSDASSDSEPLLVSNQRRRATLLKRPTDKTSGGSLLADVVAKNEPGSSVRAGSTRGVNSVRCSGSDKSGASVRSAVAPPTEPRAVHTRRATPPNRLPKLDAEPRSTRASARLNSEDVHSSSLDESQDDTDTDQRAAMKSAKRKRHRSQRISDRLDYLSENRKRYRRGRIRQRLVSSVRRTRALGASRSAERVESATRRSRILQARGESGNDHPDDESARNSSSDEGGPSRWPVRRRTGPMAARLAARHRSPSSSSRGDSSTTRQGQLRRRSVNSHASPPPPPPIDGAVRKRAFVPRRGDWSESSSGSHKRRRTLRRRSQPAAFFSYDMIDTDTDDEPEVTTTARSSELQTVSLGNTVASSSRSNIRTLHPTESARGSESRVLAAPAASREEPMQRVSAYIAGLPSSNARTEDGVSVSSSVTTSGVQSLSSACDMVTSTIVDRDGTGVQSASAASCSPAVVQVGASSSVSDSPSVGGVGHEPPTALRSHSEAVQTVSEATSTTEARPDPPPVKSTCTIATQVNMDEELAADSGGTSRPTDTPTMADAGVTASAREIETQTPSAAAQPAALGPPPYVAAAARPDVPAAGAATGAMASPACYHMHCGCTGGQSEPRGFRPPNVPAKSCAQTTAPLSGSLPSPFGMQPLTALQPGPLPAFGSSGILPMRFSAPDIPSAAWGGAGTVVGSMHAHQACTPAQRGWWRPHATAAVAAAGIVQPAGSVAPAPPPPVLPPPAPPSPVDSKAGVLAQIAAQTAAPPPAAAAAAIKVSPSPPPPPPPPLPPSQPSTMAAPAASRQLPVPGDYNTMSHLIVKSASRGTLQPPAGKRKSPLMSRTLPFPSALSGAPRAGGNILRPEMHLPPAASVTGCDSGIVSAALLRAQTQLLAAGVSVGSKQSTGAKSNTPPASSTSSITAPVTGTRLEVGLIKSASPGTHPGISSAPVVPRAAAGSGNPGMEPVPSANIGARSSVGASPTTPIILATGLNIRPPIGTAMGASPGICQTYGTSPKAPPFTDAKMDIRPVVGTNSRVTPVTSSNRPLPKAIHPLTHSSSLGKTDPHVPRACTSRPTVHLSLPKLIAKNNSIEVASVNSNSGSRDTCSLGKAGKSSFYTHSHAGARELSTSDNGKKAVEHAGSEADHDEICVPAAGETRGLSEISKVAITPAVENYQVHQATVTNMDSRKEITEEKDAVNAIVKTIAPKDSCSQRVSQAAIRSSYPESSKNIGQTKEYGPYSSQSPSQSGRQRTPQSGRQSSLESHSQSGDQRTSLSQTQSSRQIASQSGRQTVPQSPAQPGGQITSQSPVQGAGQITSQNPSQGGRQSTPQNQAHSGRQSTPQSQPQSSRQSTPQSQAQSVHQRTFESPSQIGRQGISDSPSQSSRQSTPQSQAQSGRHSSSDNPSQIGRQKKSESPSQSGRQSIPQNLTKSGCQRTSPSLFQSGLQKESEGPSKGGHESTPQGQAESGLRRSSEGPSQSNRQSTPQNQALSGRPSSSESPAHSSRQSTLQNQAQSGRPSSSESPAQSSRQSTPQNQAQSAHQITSQSPGTNRAKKRPAAAVDSAVPVDEQRLEDGLRTAPVFYPSEREFADPITYIESICSKAEPHGLCRIVPPPTFKPECRVQDNMRFVAYNHYVHKVFRRWGPNFRELLAIRRHLEQQDIDLDHIPMVGGMEVDLPALYAAVQRLGGLNAVISQRRWAAVADMIRLPKSAMDRAAKLDHIYCTYLLTYAALTDDERRRLRTQVETEWLRRRQQQQRRAAAAASDDADDSDASSDDDASECIVKGKTISLGAFYRVARNTSALLLGQTDAPPPHVVEQQYWQVVSERERHVCVYSGSVDCGPQGYGFVCDKKSPTSRLPWNMKVLSSNSGSVLRSMGPLMGVTVPTLHMGMAFSTGCWYSDPHALPWIEYLHTGAAKIWYSVAACDGAALHARLRDLMDGYLRPTPVWLPSDTAMVPPQLLHSDGVAVSRAVQQPGEFVVAFGGAYTASVGTGYTLSESVFFAPPAWLQRAPDVFHKLAASGEPAAFPLERLVTGVCGDARASLPALTGCRPLLEQLQRQQHQQLQRLLAAGVTEGSKLPAGGGSGGGKKRPSAAQQQEEERECDVCRTTLYSALVEDRAQDCNYCLEHAIELLATAAAGHVEKDAGAAGPGPATAERPAADRPSASTEERGVDADADKEGRISEPCQLRARIMYSQEEFEEMLRHVDTRIAELSAKQTSRKKQSK